VPIQDLARAFGAAIIGDTELQAGILPMLRSQDEKIRADRACTIDAVVLEALLFSSTKVDRRRFGRTISQRRFARSTADGDPTSNLRPRVSAGRFGDWGSPVAASIGRATVSNCTSRRAS
jgi:hypothetical protein